MSTETLTRHYPSLSAFTRAIDKGEGDMRKGHSSVAVRQHSWDDGTDWAEAIAIARKGGYNKRYVNNARAKLKNLPKASSTLHKKKSKTDYTGHRPHVANAIAGQPKAMRRRIRHDVPIIRMVVSVSMHAGVQAEWCVNRAAALFSVINTLESRGNKIELIVENHIQYRPGNLSCDTSVSFTLKPAHVPLNLATVSWVLASPACLRRLVFRWQELYDPRVIDYGYGMPLQPRTTADIVIPSTDKWASTPEQALAKIMEQI